VWVPWPFVAIVAGWLALRRIGPRASVGAVIAVLAIGALGMWEHTMTTLAVISVAVVISVTLGVPVGILMSRSNKAEAVIRAVLDVLQTLPIFIFVIPAVMFMGVGTVAGILATVIYAMPPVIRLTNLGLRQVNVEMIEAARAYGATERQVLWKVKIPSARASIMMGISQTTLLALAMVVVSAMIGTIGLGERVMWAVGSMKLPLGFEAGAAIIILAMLLDRIFQGRGGGEGVRVG
jgi:glycine betaine/proline transport system permease protein